MNLSYRPLPTSWPSGQRTSVYQRRRSPFKASDKATMVLLERELRNLGVDPHEAVIVEAGYAESQIRLDGRPRGDARLTDPAVILSFKSKHGHLRYGCDSFDDHMANLRAIGLALEALRAVDRYGVTKKGEQYVGWKALPGAGESDSQAWALGFLREHSGLAGGLDDAGSMFRAAAKKLHPDVGGTREGWAQLQRAAAAVGVR